MGLFGSKRPKTAGGKSLVESWMGVFFGYAHVTPVASEAQLCDAIAGGAYSCLGQRHSYNGADA